MPIQFGTMLFLFIIINVFCKLQYTYITKSEVWTPFEFNFSYFFNYSFFILKLQFFTEGIKTMYERT